MTNFHFPWEWTPSLHLFWLSQPSIFSLFISRLLRLIREKFVVSSNYNFIYYAKISYACAFSCGRLDCLRDQPSVVSSSAQSRKRQQICKYKRNKIANVKCDVNSDTKSKRTSFHSNLRLLQRFFGIHSTSTYGGKWRKRTWNSVVRTDWSNEPTPTTSIPPTFN